MPDPLIDPATIHPATGLPAVALARGPEPAQVFLADGGPQGIVQIAAWPDTAAAVADGLQLALGTAPPSVANRWTGAADTARLVWTGPHRWWLVTPDPVMAERAIAGLAPGQATLSEQGAGRSLLRVTGPAARDLLAKLCPLDLHPDTFPADGAAGTVLHHVSVWLTTADAGAGVELWLPRSSAPSTLAVLLDAGAEYGVAYKPHAGP